MSTVTSRRVCPHCLKSVSFKTYKAHRRLYYDSSKDEWFTDTSRLDLHEDDHDQPISFGEIPGDMETDMDAAPSLYYSE